jgi:hypothetical protein
MSYSVVEDYSTLPAALLPLARQHCRVDFPDDDIVITEYVAWAIAQCQAVWDFQVFGATVTWAPVVNGLARYQCPKWPVSSFTVMSGAIDVSTEYALESTVLTAPVWLVHGDGTPFHADAAVTLNAGFVVPDQMPPNAKGAILQVAAARYENRESISAITLEQIPFWFGDLIGGLWVPRA